MQSAGAISEAIVVWKPFFRTLLVHSLPPAASLNC